MPKKPSSNKNGNRRPPLAVDLFSGCGGLTLGLKQAGFKVVAAIEMDDTAAATYRLNHPEVLLRHLDIRKQSPTRLLKELGLRSGELDLLAGCPPCQGFSSLRTRNGARLNRDRRNNLVQEMLRFASVFRPKALMMENVPGLATKRAFFALCVGLERLGYGVQHEVKDASRYGVPQRRKRLILLASQRAAISFARESSSTKTVRHAIGSLTEPARSKDALHRLPETRTAKTKRRIADIPKDGGSRTQLPKHRQLACHKKSDGFKDIYGRMAWDKVAPTITSGCFNPSKGRFLHPVQDRAITMREAALLQGFPKRYRFDLSGGKTGVALMIGNALPPEFIRRHAAEILKSLNIRPSSIR